MTVDPFDACCVDWTKAAELSITARRKPTADSRDAMRSPMPIDSRRLANISTISLCAFLAGIFGLSSAAHGAEDAPPSEGADAQSQSAPALFVIDSANTLYSFDAHGKALQKMVFKSTVGTLNGGMTLAMGKVYVSYVKAADRGVGGGVFAFDATTLRQVRLHIGAFTMPGDAGDPGVIHALAYNPGNGHFRVATDRLGLLAFDRAGQYIPTSPESAGSVSAVAFDSTHTTLWAISGRAIVQYDEQSNSPVPRIPAAHAFGGHGRDPSALAYCSIAGGGTIPGAVIAVVFGRTNPAHHTGTGQTYDIAGKPLGPSYGGKIINPHGMSCSSRGEVFIAADNGLLEYTVRGAIFPPAEDLQQLRSPMYGVLAAY